MRMKRTITSQIYRRRLDRSQASQRSNEWVASVATVERRIPDAPLEEFRMLCERFGRPAIIQNNVSRTLP